jgi:hypothetical protein
MTKEQAIIGLKTDFRKERFCPVLLANLYLSILLHYFMYNVTITVTMQLINILPFFLFTTCFGLSRPPSVVSLYAVLLDSKLSVVTMKSSVFWYITSCSPVKVTRHCRGTHVLSLQGRIILVGKARNQHEASRCSEDRIHHS